MLVLAFVANANVLAFVAFIRALKSLVSFIQGSLQEQEDSEPDSSLSQSPNVQDWLSQARSTRTQQQHENQLQQRVNKRKKKLSLYSALTAVI